MSGVRRERGKIYGRNVRSGRSTAWTASCPTALCSLGTAVLSLSGPLLDLPVSERVLVPTVWTFPGPGREVGIGFMEHGDYQMALQAHRWLAVTLCLFNTLGHLKPQLNDPRQIRGLISVSPSKGPVKSRLKAADAPTPCSAPPNAAPPAPAAKCIPARIVCPSPPWKRNSLALRNSSLSNGVSVPESSGQSRLHSSP